jgi:hypothetical protein
MSTCHGCGKERGAVPAGFCFDCRDQMIRDPSENWATDGMFVRNRQNEIGTVSFRIDALTGKLHITVFWISHGKGMEYEPDDFYWEWERCDPPSLVCEACRKTVTRLVRGLCKECQDVEVEGHNPREMRVWVWQGAQVRHVRGLVATIVDFRVVNGNWNVQVRFPNGDLVWYLEEEFFPDWGPCDAATAASLERPSVWERISGEDWI